jgi:hypothetical protein
MKLEKRSRDQAVDIAELMDATGLAPADLAHHLNAALGTDFVLPDMVDVWAAGLSVPPASWTPALSEIRRRFARRSASGPISLRPSP